MLISVQDARRFLHDNESTDRDITENISAVEAYIEDGIAAVNPNDPSHKLLAKLLLGEIDVNQMQSAAQANSTSRLFNSLAFQMKIKARGVSELDTPAVEDDDNGDS